MNLSLLLILSLNYLIYINGKYINFTQLSIKNEKCLKFYNTQINNKIYKNINFDEYLEYWWNLEESEEELLNRICKYIQMKYSNNILRKKI
jgi:hypothetical protein